MPLSTAEPLTRRRRSRRTSINTLCIPVSLAELACSHRQSCLGSSSCNMRSKCSKLLSLGNSTVLSNHDKHFWGPTPALFYLHLIICGTYRVPLPADHLCPLQSCPSRSEQSHSVSCCSCAHLLSLSLLLIMWHQLTLSCTHKAQQQQQPSLQQLAANYTPCSHLCSVALSVNIPFCTVTVRSEVGQVQVAVTVDFVNICQKFLLNF